jgi:hypothetical protein
LLTFEDFGRIYGANFANSDTIFVRLGTTDSLCPSELCLRANYRSPTEILFTAKPCLGYCDAPLLVRLALNGVNFINTQRYFRFLGDTIILRMEPRVGATSGNTPVIFTATNMNATTRFTCKFGDQVVIGSFLQDTRKLLCKSPPSFVNVSVPVTIALDGQTYTSTPDCLLDSHQCFVYKSPLTMTRVYPTLGPVAGGTPIFVVGSGFYFVDGVQGLCKFSSTSQSYTRVMSFVDSNNFKCSSPPTEVKLYDFSIAGNGVDFQPSSVRFQSYKQPVLVAGSGDAVSPVASPVIGGTYVTITGSGFFNSAEGIRVRWIDERTDEGTGSTYVFSTFESESGKAKFTSDTEVVVKTSRYPYDPARTRLSLSLNNGYDYSQNAPEIFVFYETPNLFEVQPPLGPRLGETAVAILGSGFHNFRDVAKCRFGEIAVPAIFDDSIVAGAAVFRCKSPPRSVSEWVHVQIALDGQIFTDDDVKFQYYGEFDVYSINPAGGPKAGGTVVTVTGVGMIIESGKYLTCFFGEGKSECADNSNYMSNKCYRTATALFVTTTRITCISPLMPTGGTVTQIYPVRVGFNAQFSQACPNVQAGYQCPIKAGVSFVYYDDVLITGISPNSGKVQGGTEVTLYGSGFRLDLALQTRCIFTRCTDTDIYMSGENYGKFRSPTQTQCSGATKISSFSTGDVGVISASVIRCLSPMASTTVNHFTLVDISLNRGATIQNLYGPLCQNDCPVMYFYYSLPTISYNEPSLGPVMGGTVITVNGFGFIGTQNTAMRCRFGTVESTAQTTGFKNAVQYLTGSTISCVAPPQPVGVVRISVSLNGLESDFTRLELGSLYIYHDPPKLTGRPTPSVGPTTGGTSITISGTGFLTGQLQCKFWIAASKGDLNKVVRADYLSSTLISCSSPAVTQSMLVSVSLSLNGQNFSPFHLDDTFFYFPAPQILQLLPSGGPAQSGGYVMVRGKAFLKTAPMKCRVGLVETLATFFNDTFVGCAIPQTQRKTYSVTVSNLGIKPEVLSDSFSVYPVQTYPLEISFDGQTFSTSKIGYTYYHTPQVDRLVPDSGAKSKLTTVAVIEGANFRNDFGGPFCRFAGVGATKAVFISDRSIRCQIPSVPLGMGALVEISVNGQEYEDHNSASFKFMGVAPVLLRATLSPSFDRVSLDFDVDTDRGSLVGTFPCDRIIKWRREDLALPTSGLSTKQVLALGESPTDQKVFELLFGYGVECRFETNKSASLVVGVFANFKPGHPIWLKENTFQRGIELTYFASGNATLSSPYAAPKPVALISSPSEIGRCDNFNIDASASTGGLGRSLYYSWQFDRSKSTITDDNLTPAEKGNVMSRLATSIEIFSGSAFDPEGQLCRNPNCLVPKVLDANGSETNIYQNCFCNGFFLEFASYPQGAYTVQLVLSNWQNAISDVASVTVTKQWKAIPTVNIETYSSDTLFQVNRSITLSGSATQSTCNKAPPNFLFQWTILDDSKKQVEFNAAVQQHAKSITLPSYSLVAGRNYFAELRVISKDATCIIPPVCMAPIYTQDQCCVVGSDSISLKTSTSIPVAIITGGSLRTVSTRTEIYLDASESFHPDYSGSRQSVAKLTYRWTCKDTPSSVLSMSVTGGCFSSAGIAFGSSSEMSLIIPPNSMRVQTIQNEKPVDVEYEFSLNVSDSSSWNMATVRILPTRESIPLVTVTVREKNLVYPPNKKISLVSSVVSDAPLGNISFQWTTVTGDVDVRKKQFLLSSSSREPSLVIKPNVLTFGQQYTVRLSVKAAENGVAGYDQVTFNVDNPPSGGALQVSPQTGKSLETIFKFSAVNWQVQEENLPISYTFEYIKQDAEAARLVTGTSEKSVASAMLPPGTWALRLFIGNIVGSETVESTCNMIKGICLVTVDPKQYASTDAMISDLTVRKNAIENLIKAGDPDGAIRYVNLLITTINSGGGSARRRSLVADNVTLVQLQQFKCSTAAPLVYSSLPAGGLVGYPSAEVLARSTAATVLSLFSVAAEVNDECLLQMAKIYEVVLEYAGKGSGMAWNTEPDRILLQDLWLSISLAAKAVKSQYSDRAVISRETAADRIAILITQQCKVTAICTYGSLADAQAPQGLDSTRGAVMSAMSSRLSTPTTSASVRNSRESDFAGDDTFQILEPSPAQVHEGHENDQVDLSSRPSRRMLTIPNPGSTRLPAWEFTLTVSLSFSMPANVLPFVINKVPCSTGPNGAQICEMATVSATATHYVDFFNPHFYSDDAQYVIAPVLSLQLQAFGMQEIIPVAGLQDDLVFILPITRVPDSTEDHRGRHRVAACVWWNGTKWDTGGCRLSKLVQATNGGDEMRAICFCNRMSSYTIIDAPAGCDATPYSSVLYDGCLVCGGDNSTCIGCDGKVASNKVIDACGKCGGDTSSCIGCDGIPNSGALIDECNVCGGDNETCKGCDGISIHPYVTARFSEVKPKSWDTCITPGFPKGVCGGNDGSCKGCDGKVNSGKVYDKCGKCGEYASADDAIGGGVAASGWYSRTTKDDCALGLKQCASGFSPNDCGTCVSLSSVISNTVCEGCDKIASVFSYQYGTRQLQGKTQDNCGVCGGDDSSCRDCNSVVNGKAHYDRCGICQGNNTCLDCAGIPYGQNVRDICGICGGRNDAEQCRGCDGKLYSFPLRPPRLDRYGKSPLSRCCPVELIGCQDVCNATIGCDGNCSTAPLVYDKCGVCGGSGSPNSGTCDCAGVPKGRAAVGCDDVCADPPSKIDMCGVCGGNNERETGHCDCEGMPHGPATRDSSGVCCYISDMGKYSSKTLLLLT